MKVRILYLYAEVMGYTWSVIKHLADSGVEIHLVHFDDGKLTPYQFGNHKNVYQYLRSEITYISLCKTITDINPSITVISGWMDKLYLRVAKRLRDTNNVVVSGFDDQCNSTFIQALAMLLGKVRFFNRFFSHAWVCGPEQFEYAKMLGFKNNEIIYDLYSADVDVFNAAYKMSKKEKDLIYPHRFLYVGRLERVKGLDHLVKAWGLLGNNRKDWELHIIGNGSLFNEISNLDGITVNNFMQPEDLIHAIKQSGCFILPSIIEPWGVVVHEFATAGLPLLLSDAVGSRHTFHIPGTNGYCFERGNIHSIYNALKKIIDSSDSCLREMGLQSRILSARITPETSANNLLSLLS